MKNFLKCALLFFVCAVIVFAVCPLSVLCSEFLGRWVAAAWAIPFFIFPFLACFFEKKVKEKLKISTLAYIISVFVCPLAVAIGGVAFVIYLDSISYFTGWFGGLEELIVSFLLFIQTLTAIVVRGIVEIVKRVLKRRHDSSSAGEG